MPALREGGGIGMVQRIAVDHLGHGVRSCFGDLSHKTNRGLLPDLAFAEWRSLSVCVMGSSGTRGRAARGYYILIPEDL